MALVRRSCHTMAGWIGAPLRRSHTTVVSRWLAMPTAATSAAEAPAAATASRATATWAGEDFLGVVLHPAGLGEDLAELLLRHRYDRSRSVEQQRP